MASISYDRLSYFSRPARLLGLSLALAIASAHLVAAQSVITTRPDDPAAVYLASAGTNDSDDTSALQAAIDKAGASFSGGIVFIPSGRYRLTRTVYVWRGVRLIGYGATRPVFLLPDETPGFQNGVGTLIMFSGGGPTTRAVRLPPA